MAESLPESLEDTIISYLKGQEICPESDYDEAKYKENAEALVGEKVKLILEELLLKVNKRVVCKDRYQNLKTWHNQYPLFDLEDFFPDFCVDEDTMRALSFRESLLVSFLDNSDETGASVVRIEGDSREVVPCAVGSLCLNIQMVDANQPEDRPTPISSEMMDQQIMNTVKAARQAMNSANNVGELDNVLKEKLVQYEDLLREEVRANSKKFIVHLSSQFDIDGQNSGSRVTAWCDRNFHTLEEKRTEYIREVGKECITEKTLYVALQRQKYYICHTSNQEGIEERKYYKLTKTYNMICEGANFLLMRYLAIKRYTGTFELSTIYINGDMCRNIYECTGPVMSIVNDKEVEICRIYRCIMEESGIVHQCVTVMTTHGRIISQEWEGCPYILNLNPLLFMEDGKPKPYERLILEKTWSNDMELLSKYLDYKVNIFKFYFN
ncbi:unnamed protein product [Acanthoscelides obtectus]|uniref:Ciliogenesis-associated TTC17-interacting protein N-terminal domain-containing protein n=1 Tax=Acanthoscelides obtectus TaxID=200917 RepID=A0A9P0KSR2_ACAOB|nr:unnamed protein product [Acanthoscelides obtectus]CAK1672061.1 Ciliogenesis-associated TTC17-interacting protein [Acanthoscelides obtectus]